MYKCVSRFWRDESGSVAIEYGLILSLITVLLIGSMVAIGGSVNSFYTNALDGLLR